MKKSGIFIANIVLASVFGVFLLVSAGVVLVMKGSMDVIEHTYEAMDWNEIYDGGDGYSDYMREVYELPVIENAVAEPLGAEYGGESAYEGYQYYRVTVTVYNGGTEYLFADLLDFDCQGGREGDVYVEYVYEDEVVVCPYEQSLSSCCTHLVALYSSVLGNNFLHALQRLVGCCYSVVMLLPKE